MTSPPVITIDSAGRVVLPSEVRRRLNRAPGSRLFPSVVAERIELKPEALLDTSVVIASLDHEEPRHAAYDRVIAQGGHMLYSHTLAKTFFILSGARHKLRLRPTLAAQLIEQSVLPFVNLVHLSGKETVAVIADCERRGVRGADDAGRARLSGAVSVWCHLIRTPWCAARRRLFSPRARHP